MAEEAARGVPAMVETLRKAPLTPYSLPVVERFTQTLEYVVHHEDIRRAQPGWEPRTLPDADLDELWTLLSRSGGYLGRSAAGPRPARPQRPPRDERDLPQGRRPGRRDRSGRRAGDVGLRPRRAA